MRPAVAGLVTPLLVTTVAATVAAGLAGCGTQSQAGNVIAVSAGACGTGWRQVSAGMQTFQIRNSSTGGAEADLINPASGAIYAEVAGLGPGTTRPMRVDVGSGRYAFRCLLQDTDPLTGPTVRVGGHHQGAPAILPVTTDDLLGPARVYHAYVTAGLNTLARQVGVLAAADPGRPPDRGPGRVAARPPHLRAARRGVRHLRQLRHRDRRPPGRPAPRAVRPGLHRVLPDRVRAVARAGCPGARRPGRQAER